MNEQYLADIKQLSTLMSQTLLQIFESTNKLDNKVQDLNTQNQQSNANVDTVANNLNLIKTDTNTIATTQLNITQLMEQLIQNVMNISNHQNAVVESNKVIASNVDLLNVATNDQYKLLQDQLLATQNQFVESSMGVTNELTALNDAITNADPSALFETLGTNVDNVSNQLKVLKDDQDVRMDSVVNEFKTITTNIQSLISRIDSINTQHDKLHEQFQTITARVANIEVQLDAMSDSDVQLNESVDA